MLLVFIRSSLLFGPLVTVTAPRVGHRVVDSLDPAGLGTPHLLRLGRGVASGIGRRGLLARLQIPPLAGRNEGPVEVREKKYKTLFSCNESDENGIDRGKATTI